MANEPEKRFNIRSTETELNAWREAAQAEYVDLTSWIRRLAWAAIKGSKSKKKAGRR